MTKKEIYVESLNNLRAQAPETEERRDAQQRFDEVYCKTCEILIRSNHSLLDYIARNFDVPVEDSVAIVTLDAWKKKDYFQEKVEDAAHSYYQLAQKIEWLAKDHYRKTRDANKTRAKNTTGNDDGKDDKEESANEVKENKYKVGFVSSTSLEASISCEDDEGMTFSEAIPDPKAIDPEQKYNCQDFLCHVLAKIFDNCDKVTDFQLLCYLNDLSGQTSEYLVDLIKQSEDSREVLLGIADSFTRHYGYTAKSLSGLNLDLPRSVSVKSVSNRTTEARKVYDKILEKEHEEYVRHFLK